MYARHQFYQLCRKIFNLFMFFSCFTFILDHALYITGCCSNLF